MANKTTLFIFNGAKLAGNAGALDDNSKFILVDRGDSLFRIVNKGSKKASMGAKMRPRTV